MQIIVNCISNIPSSQLRVAIMNYMQGDEMLNVFAKKNEILDTYCTSKSIEVKDLK